MGAPAVMLSHPAFEPTVFRVPCESFPASLKRQSATQTPPPLVQTRKKIRHCEHADQSNQLRELTQAKKNLETRVKLLELELMRKDKECSSLKRKLSEALEDSSNAKEYIYTSDSQLHSYVEKLKSSPHTTCYDSLTKQAQIEVLHLVQNERAALRGEPPSIDTASLPSPTPKISNFTYLVASSTLWIGNLPKEADYEKLHSDFSRFGPVINIKCILAGTTKQALVCFVNIEDSILAHNTIQTKYPEWITTYKDPQMLRIDPALLQRTAKIV